ncbi:hypothetical protein C8J57DRAFT_1617837 [Mycena rebaudengoi]|nr:hypothetical protein C8J57DRAFT_1617837 [Mycena rebaudengoi]
MVSGFSTVDIKHLKSIDSSPIIPFLRENIETIQKVRIASSYYPRESPDPDILKANQTLHSIEITENSSKIVSILQRFRHLGHLKALKTISLGLEDRMEYVSPSTTNAADSTKLDAILSQAVDGLDHIHTEHPLDVGLIGSLLPSVGEKVAVHVHREEP